MSAQNAHQLESAVHVFYVKALTKILQNVTSKNKELKDQCNMVLTDLKKLEKEKQNIHIELVSNPNKYFKPLELACATKKPQIMETALDCLQKLMAHKCIDTTVKYYGDQSKLLIDVMVATICNCFEPNQDDSVQLQIMKALLTAVTSCDIKGKTVRVTVKTSFNIHLVSKSAINQKTAKATLTQMLNVIFQRMESKKGDQSQNIQLSADDMNEIAMDNANTESVSPTPVQSPAKTPASPVVSDDMPPEVSVAMFVKSCLDNVIAANDAPVKKNTVFQNQYHLDAYFIFGALCRLSMKKIPPNAPSDSMEMRSRILSLQLIHSVLENSGPVFRSTESFITDIKQFLCLSLLKNCVSAVPSIFHLSLSIFQTLIIHFKEHLKNEIGMFFTNVFLRILESNNSSYQHKILVIEVLNNICLDSQTLVDLFVNYDCALESLNIYESLVADLSKVVQQAHAEANWVTPQQESAIKQMGLKTIYTILKSLVDWMHKKEAKKAEEEVDTNQAMFDKLRQTKQDLKESIIRFNTKPKDGIEYLINAGQLKNTPADIASFLYTEGLDKKKIGEYVGSDQNQQVLAEFAKLQNFKQMDFEASIRSFLNTFRLPGEGQQIDRIMQKFAEKYFQDNSDSVFTNADAAYVFAYSVIMLNTELHSPAFNGKKRMTVQEFIKNNETVNDGSNLPEEYLTKIYNGIKNCEIKLKDEQFIEKVKEEEPEVDQNISTPKKRLLAFDKEGAKIFKVTKSMFNETWKQSQISNNSFYFASNSELVKPMLEVSANAAHQALQYMFEQSEEPEIIKLCLDSFEHATHISAHFGLNNERNNFVTSIAKFTCLSNVTMMKQKNIDCTKLIMKIALQEGNNLKSAWQQVLTCVSQLERVYSVGTSGSSADFVVDSRLDSPAIKKSASSKSLASAKVSTPAASGAQKKPDTPNMPKSQKAPPNMEQISSQTIMSQIDATILDKIFVKSADLDDDAIVHFVKGLCSVSHEELAAAEPRKFSLQKLIEVAHYNLSRIKIVWSRIWVHMAEHFITVGCPAVASANSQMIAIHAIDSLRQLAMKFLEQDELANYHFQRDFLKPFLQIMEKSQNVEIRELVVQCIGQMILKRASNIKSGWKTILQVLKKSAADGQETVVQTGFQYTTQIMNEYFVLMSDAFIDLVGCLVQFAKNQIDKRVSIQSIAFLDTCALNIVKGLVEGVKVEKDESGIAFTKDNTHYRVWFPVLTGLSHMVSDIRVEVRIKALQTLHSLLKQHGSLFGSELWKNVFTGVWFPIFADVRMLLDEANGKAIPETEWMQNTCQATLSSMIAVFSDFFDITSFMLGDLIKQVSMCFRQESKLLCTIGLAVFKELVMLTGSKFKPEHWNEICKEVQVLVERMNLSELVPPDDQPQKIKLSPVFLQTKAATILQFVQLIGDLTFSQYSNMQTSHVQMMLNALDASYKCAKLVNESHFINDIKVETVQKHKVIPINELITQEISSMAIYLNIVFKMFAETTMIDRHDVAEAIISARCIDLLQRYMVKASIIPATPEYSTVNAKEMEALIQIVVLILTGLLSFTDEQFKKHIGKFYPHITNLILSQSTEIRKMLKDVLVRVGKFTPCIAG